MGERELIVAFDARQIFCRAAGEDVDLAAEQRGEARLIVLDVAEDDRLDLRRSAPVICVRLQGHSVAGIGDELVRPRSHRALLEGIGIVDVGLRQDLDEGESVEDDAKRCRRDDLDAGRRQDVDRNSGRRDHGLGKLALAEPVDAGLDVFRGERRPVMELGVRSDRQRDGRRALELPGRRDRRLHLAVLVPPDQRVMDERSDLFIDKAETCGRVPVIRCRRLRIAKGERAGRCTCREHANGRDAQGAGYGRARDTEKSCRTQERASVHRETVFV